MLDVGANVGNSADRFLGQGWTVHAFEPDPSNRKGLQILGKNFSGLIINEQAVSDKAGIKIPFFGTSLQCSYDENTLPLYWYNSKSLST